MSKRVQALTIGAALVAVLSITVAPALAGKGGGGGGGGGGSTGSGSTLTTTIALDGQASFAAAPMVSGPASFDVTRSTPYDKYTIYVVNTCWDASGNQVLRVGYQVLWGSWDSLSGNTGPMPTGGTHCSAYVSINNKQSGDAVSFSVAS
jgi:hypothetical protein